MCAGSSSGGGCVCEKKTGAGEAGFGFLEFGDVDGRDMEAGGFQPGASLGERSGEDDRVRESQRIGCLGLFRSDTDPIVTGKRTGVEPGAVGEQCITAYIGDRGFQVQAAGYRDPDDFVLVRLQNSCKLPETFGVGASG